MPEVAAFLARASSSARLAAACLLVSACIGHRVVYPVLTVGPELNEFEAAGPADLQIATLDVSPMLVSGPYRIGAGDLLALELPPEVHALETATESGVVPVTSLTVRARVQKNGNVLLPMIGNVAAAGRTAGELEDEIRKGLRYSPENLGGLAEEPGVVVTVSEFQTVGVIVTGAVNQPGQHELRSDQRSVTGALSAAGGIKSERGAREIRVIA